MNSYFQDESLAPGLVGEDDSGDVMVGMMYLVTMVTLIVVVIGMVLVEVVVKLWRKKDDSGHELDVDQ